MNVRFYSKPKLNKARTAEAGRPIFDDVEMCEVILDDRNFNPHFPAHETTITYDKQAQMDDTRTWAERFPEAYRAFKMRHEAGETGTPLSEWPVVTRAKASELNALGVTTVEQLAAMPESTLRVLGAEGRQLAAQAQAYMQTAQEAAPMNRLALENEDLKARLAALEARLGGMDDEEEGDDEPRRRGRPRKAAA